jgi:hypothetical protein
MSSWTRSTGSTASTVVSIGSRVVKPITGMPRGTVVSAQQHGGERGRPHLQRRAGELQQQGGEGDHRHAVAALRRAWPAAL